MKGEEIDYRLVVNAKPALIFSARSDGYIDDFNRRWFQVLGARQDELERVWVWTRFIHPSIPFTSLTCLCTELRSGIASISSSRLVFAGIVGDYQR